MMSHRDDDGDSDETVFVMVMGWVGDYCDGRNRSM